MKIVKMERTKKIALVAHDNRKKDLIAWIKAHQNELENHTLFGTGTTAALITKETGLTVKGYKSGPLGGDQQIGARIVEDSIDFLIFFWDPMYAQPHDPDVKALLRIAVLSDIPVAMNQATADFVFSSTLINEQYDRKVIDYYERLKEYQEV